MPSGAIVFSLTDYDGEHASVAFPVATTIAGNFTAQVAAMAALQTAVDNCTLGRIWREALRNYDDTDHAPGELPTSDYARREQKALVQMYAEDSHTRYRIEIPTTDRTKLHANGDGLFWSPGNSLNDADWTAFLEEIQAAPYLGPRGATDGLYVVLRVVDVGRNL